MQGENRELPSGLFFFFVKENRAEQIEVYCVPCRGQTMESVVRVSTRALVFEVNFCVECLSKPLLVWGYCTP